jgi:HPt (histidine-containing phosphotransfer) domain-containing protein
MNDHVAKPVDPNVLFETLLRWLPDTSDPAATQDPGPVARRQECHDVCARFTAIEGLDVEQGLRFANDRDDLYFRLLRRFVDNQDFAALTRALSAQDYVAARRLAHTLGSTCGTLGAVGLREMALRIESGLTAHSSRPGDLPRQADAMEVAFRQLSCRIAPLLAPEATRSHLWPSANPESLKTVLSQLTELLAVGDTAALKLFQDNHDAIRSALGDSATGVAQHLDRFEFDEALSKLRPILDGL